MRRDYFVDQIRDCPVCGNEFTWTVEQQTSFHSNTRHGIAKLGRPVTCTPSCANRAHKQSIDGKGNPRPIYPTLLVTHSLKGGPVVAGALTEINNNGHSKPSLFARLASVFS